MKALLRFTVVWMFVCILFLSGLLVTHPNDQILAPICWTGLVSAVCTLIIAAAHR